MKITKNITITGKDVIADYFVPEAEKQGIKLESKNVKVSVWSATKEQFIDFEAKNVLFIWTDAEPVKVEKPAAKPAVTEPAKA